MSKYTTEEIEAILFAPRQPEVTRAELVDALRDLELAAALYMFEGQAHLKRLDTAITNARALLARIDEEA